MCFVPPYPSNHLRRRHFWRFLDDEAGKEHHNRPAEPPRHVTWRVAADLNEDTEHKLLYNSWFVVCAAPSEPAFEAQMILQRYLPPPMTLHEAEARALKKRPRPRPSSAAGVEQPGKRSFLALCTGTGILPGMLALRGYSGEMIDDGKCVSAQDGALWPRNWWHRERPVGASPFDGLEILSRELRLRGVGQGGESPRRVELTRADTAELQVEDQPVAVARLHVQKLPLALYPRSPVLLRWLGPAAGLLPWLAGPFAKRRSRSTRAALPAARCLLGRTSAERITPSSA